LKKAILQVADTGPLESLVVMLNAVGYECYLPGIHLRRELRCVGCDNVLDIEDLISTWGYERPFTIGTASVEDMETADLYVDIKAHRNGPRVWERWPNLQNGVRTKVLWYRINGGEPEITEHGDEINVEYTPVLTPNQWYGEDGPWKNYSYTCWPPFYRFDDYNRTEDNHFRQPISLVHNVNGWGYGALAPELRKLGVYCYGKGSPDGLIQHGSVKDRLREAVCMVHLKSSDAPAYALYEALASACPVVVPRRLIWRSHMQELLIPGETCLVFDRETHDPLSEDDIALCTREIEDSLHILNDPATNRRIGEAGRAKLQELMWKDCEESADVTGLGMFMQEMFG